MHPDLVPKKKKFSKRVNKLQVRFSKVVNRLLLPLRIGFVFRDGKWQFRRVRMKPKKLRHTFEDATPNWNFDGAAALPLDENARRRLVETPVHEMPASTQKPGAVGKVRRYLKPGLTVEEFFKTLNELKVRYVVLRWFDELPSVADGEDIDILVGDEDMGKIDQLFSDRNGANAVKCDVYSSGGLPGSDFEGLPYYEKRLADELLDNAVLHKDIYRVPDPRRHLLSLAYHAAYHKAHASGLSLNAGEPPIKPKAGRDYAAAISDLAADQGIEVETSLQGLHDFLNQQGWMPAIDTLRKLSMNRPVIRHFLKDSEVPSAQDALRPQLCVLLVRQWAVERNLVPWICANLRHFGFDIKWIHDLDETEREQAEQRIRGGNWNQGPYPVSGGPPQSIIVACDYAPEPPDGELLRLQPFAQNARLMMMKKLLRKSLNRYLPRNLRSNPFHTADDELEAWDYLEAVCPQKVETIRQRVAEGYRGDPNLRLRLSRGKRASTYLVYRDGKPCVLKVFADHPDGRAAHNSEKRASEVFANEPWASGWLEFGPTWMLQEFFNPAARLDLIADKLDEEDRLRIAGEALSIARAIHAAGFAHRDLHAENFFLVDGRLRVIDFETLADQDVSVPFEESYDVTGKGLESPGVSGRMCYTNSKNDRSLSRVLKVPLPEALKAEQGQK